MNNKQNLYVVGAVSGVLIFSLVVLDEKGREPHVHAELTQHSHITLQMSTFSTSTTSSAFAVTPFIIN